MGFPRESGHGLWRSAHQSGLLLVTACANTSNGCALPAQTLHRVSSASFSQASSLVMAALAVWNRHVRQAVLECLLGSGWGTRLGSQLATVSTHPLCPPPGPSFRSQHSYVPPPHKLLTRVQASHSPPVCPTGLPTSQGGCLSLVGPQD